MTRSIVLMQLIFTYEPFTNTYCYWLYTIILCDLNILLSSRDFFYQNFPDMMNNVFIMTSCILASTFINACIRYSTIHYTAFTNSRITCTCTKEYTDYSYLHSVSGLFV